MTRRNYMLFLLLIILLNFETAMDITEAQEQIYILKLNYNNGSLSLIDLDIGYGYVPDSNPITQPETGYRCEVISLTDDVLYSFRFVIPNTVSSPPPLPDQEPTGEISLDNVNFTLLIPYYSDGKLINIYDPEDILLFSIDISKFADQELVVTEPGYQNYLSYFIIVILVVLIIFVIYKKLKKSGFTNFL